MNYAVYNKELTAYSISGIYAPESYERNYKNHVNENSPSYGDVLVSLKRQKSGFTLKFRFYYRNHFYWKPSFHWKYSKYFHWLFFMFWFDYEYEEVIDKVIKDHLSDYLKTYESLQKEIDQP